MASEETWKIALVNGSNMVEIRDVTLASDLFLFYLLEHLYNKQY